MFIIPQRNSVSTASINIEDLLDSINEISKVIKKTPKQLQKDVSKLSPKAFDVYEKEEKAETEEFSKACNEYLEQVLSFANGFELIRNTTIILIVKDDSGLIIVQDQSKRIRDNFCDDLQQLLYNKHILADYGTKKLGKDYDFLHDMENTQFYTSCIRVRNRQYLEATIIPTDYFNFDDVNAVFIDVNNVWVNSKLANKKYGVNLLPKYQSDSPLRVYLSPCDNKMMGVVLDDYVLVTNPEIYNYISPAKQSLYMWWKIQHNIYNNEIKDHLPKTKLIEDFFNASKIDDFCKKLTWLKNNFFSEDVPREEYKAFYQKIIRFDQLEGEQSGLDLYVRGERDDFQEQKPVEPTKVITNENSKTLLGIYRKQKIDEDYQLLSIYEEKNKSIFLRKNYGEPEPTNANIVYILKPELAYYYISDFFEDMLEEILKDILAQKIIDGYVRNYTLLYKVNSKNEYDFIVKMGEKIIVIEAKTTLATGRIDSFVKMAESYIKHSDTDPKNVEFILVGLNSNPELFVMNRIFREVESGYNKYPEGCNTAIFFFKPKIEHPDKILYCFNQPVYSKLKTQLINLFKQLE